MNRRSALQIIGASLFAPIVRLRPTVDREKLLRAFCDDWGISRYDLDQPFNVGSLTYASDSRSAVRAELCSAVEDGTRRIPDMDCVWQRLWHPSEFVPFELPPVDSPLLVKPLPVGNFMGMGTCPLCDDRRISFGEHYPSSLDEERTLPGYDPDDNTYRDPSCPLCRGMDFTGPSELIVQGVRMNYSRLKPIAALPNVRVAGNLRHVESGGPLVFKADGFEGLAMGLSGA
jgi:hypothetical protein